MSPYPDDLSTLTGSGLVHAYLDAVETPCSSPCEWADFYAFKARVFDALADLGTPDAAEVADRARLMRSRVLDQNENRGGGVL
ncbi:hypothetical protein [Nocardiopsis sp. CNT312]|uniref:hypothetical protein n=1 Tax=Nocardiopsis sp. CNT312 TaxID=1137268 RepID=UPI00049142A8|nr:hypothetical protein [Nocardiopsis sp. CNT312]